MTLRHCSLGPEVTPASASSRGGSSRYRGARGIALCLARGGGSNCIVLPTGSLSGCQMFLILVNITQVRQMVTLSSSAAGHRLTLFGSFYCLFWLSHSNIN